MLFVGNDWAEDHHDVEIVDEQGRRLARKRLPEGLAGIAPASPDERASACACRWPSWWRRGESQEKHGDGDVLARGG